MLAEWLQFPAKDPIPIGLIIFYNDTEIPDKWERYAGADDKFIIGAGDTYAAKDTDAGGGAINIPSATAGLHTHTSSNQNINAGANTSYVDGDPPGASGDHLHYGQVTYTPARNELVMIKNTVQTLWFPPNAIVLGTDTLTGLSATSITDGRLLCGGDTIASHTESKTMSLSTSGFHSHGSDSFVGYAIEWGTYTYQPCAAGSHNDGSPTWSMTPNLKNALLSLWTHAIRKFTPDRRMIAMWEDSTAPKGWKLCDGTNDTPDLRDCFISPCASGSENTTATGDNTVSGTIGAITHACSHNHRDSIDSTYNSSTCSNHTYEAWSHTHAAGSLTDLAWVPPYYALTFIMKK